MGANAVTTVPVYTAGEVLTAADMNITNSGIPVFATTVTRDAAFGGTGEKTLAEGQFAYIEATNTTQYYDGAAWQSVGNSLTLLSTTTLSGATTTISAIDQTYNQIYGTISGVTNATADGDFRCYVNNAATGNYYVGSRLDSGTAAAVAGANDSWRLSANTNLGRTNANNFFSFYMNNYASTTSYKNINWSGSWNGDDLFIGTYGHMSNTAITSLVFLNSGGNLSTGTVTLYGVK